MDMNTRLGNRDRRLLLDLIEACHSEPAERFEQFIYPKLRELLPHDMFMCGYGNADGRVRTCLNISFPQEYLDLASIPERGLVCPMVGGWIRTIQPIYYNSRAVSGPVVEPKLHDAMHDVNMIDIAVHGLIVSRRLATAHCYAFARLGDAWSPRTVGILRLVIPHIHAALIPQGATEASIERPIQLTRREYDVLCWLTEGKTDSDLATLLNISICTVHIHVQNIIHKLGAANRTHAVAKALRSGMVSL